MNSNWISADMKKFVVFILSHGRPHLKDTYNILRSCGYSGKVIIVVDNEDNTLEEYYKEYGQENVYLFDKKKVADTFDMMNNFGKRNSITCARNVCWDIAKKLGYEYFQELDDDYYYFGHKRKERAKKTISYNLIAKWFIEFLLNTNDNVKTIAFSQGGDHIGGYDEDMIMKRKAMNSFFCLTNRRFQFVGLFNEDVNTYTSLGVRGDVFFTFMPFKLDQADTQQTSGGITELYKSFGTYVKSFTTVMIEPSCVTIKTMGCRSQRLHHHVDWLHCTPCIISEEHKKT